MHYTFMRHVGKCWRAVFYDFPSAGQAKDGDAPDFVIKTEKREKRDKKVFSHNTLFCFPSFLAWRHEDYPVARSRRISGKSALDGVTVQHNPQIRTIRNKVTGTIKRKTGGRDSDSLPLLYIKRIAK